MKEMLMKRRIGLMLLCILLLLSACKKSQEGTDTTPTEDGISLKIVSYNMLFEHEGRVPSEPERQWVNRLPNVVRTFSLYQFDIVGSQELVTKQVNEFLSSCPAYGRIGKDVKGATGADTENEAIFYRKSRFSVIKQGQFWFSDSPEVVASKWGIHIRCCCWAKFREIESGKVFWVFNSHFHVNSPEEKWDHGPKQGKAFTNEDAMEIRKKSSQLVLDVINGKKTIPNNDIGTIPYGEPVFLTGDLNCQEEEEAIQLIENDTRKNFKDARKVVSRPEGPRGSVTEFESGRPTKRIDWLFVYGKVTPVNFRIIDDQIQTLKWESDHLPVMFTCKI